MSLPNYLANIKSSGIYRFVWDKSEIEGVPAEVLRLVVGYSEKGPFNTPVYVKSEAEFKSIYGNISKKLEKRGIFFHRLATQCLEKGPILALNLKKFENEAVDGISFNVDSAELEIKDIKVENIYDTTRFWKLDPDAMANALENTGYISIAATDTKETSKSIFIRGYKPTGYDITVKNWYNLMGEEIPEYFVNEDGDFTSCLISDFWAEVFVFNGEFTPATCASEPLKKYFDIVNGKPQLKTYIVNAFGEKIDTLTALTNDSNSNFVNSYAGCLIPYFKNQNGFYSSLDLTFNNDNTTHNMMMHLNSDALYNGEIEIASLITNGWGKTDAFGFALAPTYLKYDNGSYVNEPGKEATAYDPDYIVYPAEANFEKVLNVDDTIKTYTYKGTEKITIDYNIVYAMKFENKDTEGDFLYVYNNKTYVLNGEAYELSENQLENPADSNYLSFAEVGLSTGDRIMATDGEEKPVIYTISNIESELVIAFDPKGEEITITIGDGLTKCNHFVTITSTNLKPIYLEGYVYSKSNPAASSDKMQAKLDWQKDILSTLTEYAGIRTALTNRTDIDYRYIVDTFEAYVENEVHKELALIAKEKDNAIAFLNFPTMKTFKDCEYIRFTDADGKLQTKFIVEGGNKKFVIPNGKGFALVSELNGASYVSYNTPLVFTDGIVKTVAPSAGLVSNNFMDKHIGRQPYYIVAGPNYGKMTYTGLVGPEYNFTRADLDLLEPFGVNAMVYVPRIGTYINSNQTAKQNPVTGLSKINVRELVIYIQDEIEKLLQDYQWEFNTPYLRDLIKSKADSICERVKNNNGLYQYLNVCDESNNTDDVINNEMLVLSTSIEPGMGAGKMVQELTIYRKGGISSIIK